MKNKTNSIHVRMTDLELRMINELATLNKKNRSDMLCCLVREEHKRVTK